MWIHSSFGTNLSHTRRCETGNNNQIDWRLFGSYHNDWDLWLLIENDDCILSNELLDYLRIRVVCVLYTQTIIGGFF